MIQHSIYILDSTFTMRLHAFHRNSSYLRGKKLQFTATYLVCIGGSKLTIHYNHPDQEPMLFDATILVNLHYNKSHQAPSKMNSYKYTNL